MAFAMLAAFPSAADTFVVNTDRDGVDLGGGLVSLRMALNSAASGLCMPNDGDDYLITFGDALFAKSDSVTVSLTNSAALAIPSSRVTVCGRTDGKRVKLLVRGGANPVFTTGADASLAISDMDVEFDTDTEYVQANTPTSGILLDAGGGFSLLRCSFTGIGSANGCIVRSNGSSPSSLGLVEQCSFTGTRCGTLFLCGDQRYRLVNDTFSGIVATRHPGIVSLCGGGDLDSLFVSCTMESCRAGKGGLYLPDRGRTGAGSNVVANAMIFLNYNSLNSRCDANDASGRTRFAYTSYGSVSVSSGKPAFFTNCLDLVAAGEAEVFDGNLSSVRVCGSTRAYRAILSGGIAHAAGAYVIHDEGWTNVTVCGDMRNLKTTGIALCGSVAASSRLLLDEDVASRFVWSSAIPWNDSNAYNALPELRAVPGSYATVRDAEASGEPGLLMVTSLADDAVPESRIDPTDGELTLREAVASLSRLPGWRDADGNATIRFSDDLFSSYSRRTCTLSNRQIEIGGMTRGTLSIIGSDDTLQQLVMSGGGAHRIFYVAPGNRVTLSGFTFTNAVAEVAGEVETTRGGAICNAGTVTLRDCSFAGCRAPSSGFSEGGALANSAGATSVVERCSFTGCSAMNGGAVANADGGDLIVYGSTFACNSACGTAAGTDGCGGAVWAPQGASRTALVNCTLAGNSSDCSGGGLWAAGDADAVRVFLLNTVAAGNRAGGSGRDVATFGRTLVRTCALGDCSDADNDSLFDVDRSATGLGLVSADVFSSWDSTGLPIATNDSALAVAVTHTFFPLSTRATFSPSVVRSFSLRDGVFYASSSSSFPKTLWGNPNLAMVAPIRTDDLLGARGSADAYPGSIARYQVPAVPAPDADDPLCVAEATETAFLAAVQYAASHPDAASNGCFTVRFAGNPTIALSSPLEVSAFSSVPLKILGPVTFTGGGACRLFTVNEGNSLNLESVTLANGYDGAKGGGAYVEGGTLVASNCTFTGCTTGTGDDNLYGMGGAVALWTDPDAEEAAILPNALFEDCTFTSCKAGIGAYGAYGNMVYLENQSFATFRRCKFGTSVTPADNDIFRMPYVCVEKGTGDRCYCGTVAGAIASECQAGDTLVRLDADAPVPEDAALPPGVSFRDEAGDGTVSLSLLANTQKGLASYYSATLLADGDGNATGFTVSLKSEEIVPELGEGAEVDMAGSGTTVSVTPSNVKAGLWYGLGRSATPTGEFTVEKWVKAAEDGTLPLTAPKSGASGFYRVKVTDSPGVR